jgi:hypothetical protein
MNDAHTSQEEYDARRSGTALGEVYAAGGAAVVASNAEVGSAVAEMQNVREASGVLAVHPGHSANCSSIGSVVDVLFVSSVVGTALLAALGVLLGPSPEDRSAPSVNSEDVCGRERDVGSRDGDASGDGPPRAASATANAGEGGESGRTAERYG